MSTYIVYSLNTNNNQLDIISIENDEQIAKNIQNNHSFNLLCDLNKNKSSYKLEIKHNIIQIIEINIDIKNGWISNTITENKQAVYEIGVISYFKKEKLPLYINETYIPSIPSIPSEHKSNLPKVPSAVFLSMPCLPKSPINMGSNNESNSHNNNNNNNNNNNIHKSSENVKKKESKPNLSVLLLEELKKKCKRLD